MIQDGTIAESKLASGVNTITMADMFRLTANTNESTNGVVGTNWERVDTADFSKIGTGLTESSGIFSFPETGIYYINFIPRFIIVAGDTTAAMELYTTNDNSSYTRASSAVAGNPDGTNTAGFSASASFIFDVQNTSNYKFKFETSTFSSGTKLTGDTAFNRTHFAVIRLGDT